MSTAFRWTLRAIVASALLGVLCVAVVLGDSWINGARADRLHSRVRVGMPAREVLHILDESGSRVQTDSACRRAPTSRECTAAGVEIYSPLFTVHTFSLDFKDGRVSSLGPVGVW